MQSPAPKNKEVYRRKEKTDTVSILAGSYFLECVPCHSERNKSLALIEQKLALSVAEWVEGEESHI